jgi:AcrR family transcriptional regulator
MKQNQLDKPLPKRDEIVARAYEVFYKHGFHATGVDKLLADSGISKRTVYRYFRSKEELIAAAIAHYQHLTFVTVQEQINRRAKNAKEKILTLFDLRKDLLEKGDYSGCFAINAKLEYEGKHAEIEKACATFLSELEQFITSLCAEAGCTNPAATATQITLLFEGAIVYGQAKRNPEIAQISKEMARALL